MQAPTLKRVAKECSVTFKSISNSQLNNGFKKHNYRSWQIQQELIKAGNNTTHIISVPAALVSETKAEKYLSPASSVQAGCIVLCHCSTYCQLYCTQYMLVAHGHG